MDCKLGSCAHSKEYSAIPRGSRKISQEFQWRKRPIYTPALLKQATNATNAQPTQCPNSRRMASCMRKSETIPSNNPVKANQINIITSYQMGKFPDPRARC